MTFQRGTAVDLATEVERALGDVFVVDACLGATADHCRLLGRHVAADGRPVVVHGFARRALRRRGLEARYARIVERWQAFAHPRAMRLVAHGSSPLAAWCAVEAADGVTLADEVARRGPLSPAEAIGLVELVAGVLVDAHRAGLPHGALRPALVIRARDGGVRISEFGIAALLDELAGLPMESDAARGDQAGLARLYRALVSGRSIAPSSDEWESFGSDATLGPALVRAEQPDPARRFERLEDFVAAIRGSRPVPPREPGATGPQRLLFVDPVRSTPRSSRVALTAFTALTALTALIATAVPASRSQRYEAPVPEPGVRPADQGPSGVVQPPLGDHPREGGPPIAPAEARKSAASTRASAAEPPPVASYPRPDRAPSPPAVSIPADRPLLPAQVGVSARPWGHIYIDGRYVGDTPIAAIGVEPGLRRIRVVRAGYRPAEREILLSPGDRVRLTDIRLERETP